MNIILKTERSEVGGLLATYRDVLRNKPSYYNEKDISYMEEVCSLDKDTATYDDIVRLVKKHGCKMMFHRIYCDLCGLKSDRLYEVEGGEVDFTICPICIKELNRVENASDMQVT